jgi:hypothetical protein
MGLHRSASRNNLGTVCLALTLSLFAAGCKKKVPPATPPPPAPPPKVEVVKPNAPTISSFEAGAVHHRARTGRHVALGCHG